MVIIGRMSDDKPKPVDDLKEGLGLLFRAAKGAVERLPTDKLEKLEDVAKDAAREVGRAFESIGNEIEKVVNRATGAQPPPAASPAEAPEAKQDAEAPKEQYDDGYAPEPPKGPRVG
jgi:hypothetical protein